MVKKKENNCQLQFWGIQRKKYQSRDTEQIGEKRDYWLQQQAFGLKKKKKT